MARDAITNFTDEVINVLRDNAGTRMSAREIAEAVFKKFPKHWKENRRKRKIKFKTDDKFIGQLSSQVHITIRRDGNDIKYPQIKVITTSGPGRDRYKFLWEDLTNQESEGVRKGKRKYTKREEALYENVKSYVSAIHRVYPARIDEKRSKKEKKGTNKWVHPDIVGFEDLSTGWSDYIKDTASMISGRQISLWSIEVKTEIEPYNVRNSYSQAVLNSSWANHGYLAAAKIDDKAVEDLRVLSRRHGIGVIKIDTNDPVENSEVIIGATVRPAVDWAMIDRLAKLNEDYEQFFYKVQIFLRTGRIEQDGDSPD